MPPFVVVINKYLSEWLIVAGAIGVGAVLLFGFRGEPPFRPGVSRNLTVTVVPEDASGLKCMEPRVTRGLSCEGTGSTRLQPFVTTERELILLSGVFAYPAVQTELRAHQRKRGNERRFAIKCRTELLEYSRAHQVQFGRRGRVEPAAAWIAKTLDCTPTP